MSIIRFNPPVLAALHFVLFRMMILCCEAFFAHLAWLQHGEFISCTQAMPTIMM
jgi:hypothetical protein